MDNPLPPDAEKGPLASSPQQGPTAEMGDKWENWKNALLVPLKEDINKRSTLTWPYLSKIFYPKYILFSSGDGINNTPNR